MAFSLEDQYQQYLYPDAMNHVEKEDNYAVQIDKHKKALPSNAIKVFILDKPSNVNKRLIKFFKANLDYMNKKGLFFDWEIVYEDEVDFYEDQNITEFPLMMYNDDHIVGANAIIDALKTPSSNKKQYHSGGDRGSHGSHGGRGGNGGRRPGNVNIDNEENLKDYFTKELENKDDDDMDDDEIFANTITQRVAAMNKARTVNGQPSVKMSNPEVYERTARDASRNKTYNFNENQQPVRRDDNLAYHDNQTETAGASTVDILRQKKKNGSADTQMDDQMEMQFWENQEMTDID